MAEVYKINIHSVRGDTTVLRMYVWRSKCTYAEEMTTMPIYLYTYCVCV